MKDELRTDGDPIAWRMWSIAQNQLCVKTTHDRCGPFSLVVLSQRRGRVTTSSGPTLSETLSSKTLQVS